MRLFVAYGLPDEVKMELATGLAPLRRVLPRARWVSQSAYHLTFAFLGEVDGDLVAPLSQALRDKLEPEDGFRSHFAGVGTFPASGPVRIVWIGLEPAVRLARLAELARDAICRVGAPFDDKLFRAHVTLARCDPPWPARWRQDLAALAAPAVAGHSSIAFPCERVTLFSSALLPGGPTYRAEAEFVLRSP